MSTMQPWIKCGGVPYRQGWVEVAANIHTGHVNIEAWNVAPEVDMSNYAVTLASVPDGAVTGNVEVELTVAQAKQLVVALQSAIAAAENAGSG
jgi:hypothetical protein